MGLNKDQIKGRVNAVEGKFKEVVGKIVGNKGLESKGSAQKAVGLIQGTYGDFKEDVKKSVKGS